MFTTFQDTLKKFVSYMLILCGFSHETPWIQSKNADQKQKVSWTDFPDFRLNTLWKKLFKASYITTYGSHMNFGLTKENIPCEENLTVIKRKHDHVFTNWIFQFLLDLGLLKS